jgi:hypothetical protein
VLPWIISTSKIVAPIATTSEIVTPGHRSCHLQDVALATSKSVTPIETMLELVTLGHHSFHIQECHSHINHIEADTSSRRSCHLHNISLATSEMLLLPPLKCLSFHLHNFALATSGTSLFPPLKCLSCHL